MLIQSLEAKLCLKRNFTAELLAKLSFISDEVVWYMHNKTWNDWKKKGNLVTLIIYINKMKTPSPWTTVAPKGKDIPIIWKLQNNQIIINSNLAKRKSVAQSSCTFSIKKALKLRKLAWCCFLTLFWIKYGVGSYIYDLSNSLAKIFKKFWGNRDICFISE